MLRSFQLTPIHEYSPGNGNQVYDRLRFITAVNGSLAWSNAGFALTSEFAASGRVIWDVRCAQPRNLSSAGSFCPGAAAGSVYVTNFDETIGVRVSAGNLCATIPGLGEKCI